jgi:hypothetical protein
VAFSLIFSNFPRQPIQRVFTQPIYNIKFASPCQAFERTFFKNFYFSFLSAFSSISTFFQSYTPLFLHTHAYYIKCACAYARVRARDFCKKKKKPPFPVQGKGGFGYVFFISLTLAYACG